MTSPKPPCDFDSDFLADLPYHPRVLLFDRLEELDGEAGVVRCRMPTDRPMPFMDAQRNHPVLHPAHVAGSALVHATGMLGFVHAYFLLGLRHHEGWIGYGTNIHEAKFRKLAEPGAPIDAKCTATKLRRGKSRHVVRYSFDFRQEGERVYEGDQSAIWLKIDPDAPRPPA